MDTDLTKGCFGLVFIRVYLRSQSLSRGSQFTASPAQSAAQHDTERELNGE